MCFVPVVHASGVYFAKKTHCVVIYFLNQNKLQRRWHKLTTQADILDLAEQLVDDKCGNGCSSSVVAAESVLVSGSLSYLPLCLLQGQNSDKLFLCGPPSSGD